MPTGRAVACQNWPPSNSEFGGLFFFPTQRRKKPMTVKKVDLGDAGKSFDRAESHLMRNAINHADPLYNFSAAVQNYFGGWR